MNEIIFLKEYIYFFLFCLHICEKNTASEVTSIGDKPFLFVVDDF